MSQFEYREIAPSHKEITDFAQLDLYFFKPKATSVGVKARFSNQRPKQCWDVDQIQFKFIKNCKDIRQGKTILENWKKVKFNSNFRIYTPEFIEHHPEVFQKDSAQGAVRAHLQQITFHISEALKHGNLKQKHLKNNPQLAAWLLPEDTIANIFLVLKNKHKWGKAEEGYISISRLYHPSPQKYVPRVYYTRAFEAAEQDKLVDILKGREVEVKENISYPTFLQKVELGQL